MKRLLIHCILMLALLLAAIPVAATELFVMTEHNPPFNFQEQGTVHGLATDLFLAMTEEAGINCSREDIQLWPWARAYGELQTNPNAILFSAARTELREKSFQWIGPIYNLQCSLVARKASNVRITDIVKDSERYTIGTVRESAPEQVLINKGVNKELLQRVHHLDLNVKKLTEGRIDALLFNEPAILFNIKRMGLNPEEFEVVHVMFEAPLYFAANLDMEPATVSRLQKALEKLQSDGRAMKIIQKY